MECKRLIYAKLFKLEEFRERFEEYKMSEDISQLPPQIQQRLLRLQQLQQTLQGVMAQKQQLSLQLNEVENASSELEKLTETAVIYKSIGALLVKAEKDKVAAELTERKELLKMRVDVLAKQEERLRTQVKDLQDKLQQDLRPVSGSSLG
jgi:prefoldin beta subunit